MMCAHGRDSLMQYCASCAAEMVEASRDYRAKHDLGEPQPSVAGLLETLRLNHEVNKVIDKACVNAQIEVLEWVCATARYSNLLGDIIVMPETVENRIGKLRIELEKLRT